MRNKKLAFVLGPIAIIVGFISECVAQDNLFVNAETKKVTFERVIIVDSLTADQIFDKAKEWFLVKLNQTNENIMGEVRPTILKLSFTKTYTLGMGLKDKFSHNVVIRIKDGSVKLTIDNIVSPAKPPDNKEFRIEVDSIKPDGSIRSTNRIKEINSNLVNFANLLTDYLNAKSDW